MTDEAYANAYKDGYNSGYCDGSDAGGRIWKQRYEIIFPLREENARLREEVCRLKTAIMPLVRIASSTRSKSSPGVTYWGA